MPDQTLIFLHIPKAAGNTLRDVLARQFPRDAVFNYYSAVSSPGEWKGLSKEDRARLELVSGHFPFGLHECLAQPWTYVTMLRDPIDRVVSHYYFVRRTPDHYLYDQVTSRNMSLQDYVSSDMSEEFSNGQTCLISGIVDTPTGIGTTPAGADILQTAKSNMENHFTCVGLCERFDESLLLFRRRLGLTRISYVKRNVTQDRPPKESIPKATLELIRARNELDIELYGFAERMFEEAIREAGWRFQRDLRAFRLTNRLYQVGFRLGQGAMNRGRSVVSRIRQTD